MYCIILNITDYQLALYIYGPGGTGKTTFVNLITYILGSDASYATTLKGLKSRFGLSSLENKLLLVINDMSYYKGEEPQILKELITGDKMEREIKYKDPVAFIPGMWITIVSNVIWDIKNQTSGLSRRMIYYPFENVPETRIPNLLKLDVQDNQDTNNFEENSLKPFIPGLINWILSCPEADLNILQQGGEGLTSLLNPNNLKTNPLKTWVEEYLESDPDSLLPVGNKIGVPDTLFGNYTKWATLNSLDLISNLRFSDQLIDTLITMKWPKICKKRTTKGIHILGVNFKN